MRTEKALACGRAYGGGSKPGHNKGRKGEACEKKYDAYNKMLGAHWYLFWPHY
jgi:hypothetical protein